MLNGSGRSVAYRIRYTDIPKENTTITVPNRRAAGLAYLAMLVTILALNTQLSLKPEFSWLAGLVLFALFLVTKRYCLIKLIQFNTNMGRLQLIQDGRTESLPDEILKRRKQAFLGHYDDKDIRAAPGEARKALLWLQKQGPAVRLVPLVGRNVA